MNQEKIGAFLKWGFGGIVGAILLTIVLDDDPSTTPAPSPSIAAPSLAPEEQSADSSTDLPPTEDVAEQPPPIGGQLSQGLLHTSELRFLGVGSEDEESERGVALFHANPAAMTVCEGEDLQSAELADDVYQSWDISYFDEEAVGNEISSFYGSGAIDLLEGVREAAHRCSSSGLRIRPSPVPQWADDLVHLVWDSNGDDPDDPPVDWVFVRRGQVLIQLVLRKAHGSHSEDALALAIESASRVSI